MPRFGSWWLARRGCSMCDVWMDAPGECLGERRTCGGRRRWLGQVSWPKLPPPRAGQGVGAARSSRLPERVEECPGAPGGVARGGWRVVVSEVVESGWAVVVDAHQDVAMRGGRTQAEGLALRQGGRVGMVVRLVAWSRRGGRAGSRKKGLKGSFLNKKLFEIVKGPNFDITGPF